MFKYINEWGRSLKSQLIKILGRAEDNTDNYIKWQIRLYDLHNVRT